MLARKPIKKVFKATMAGIRTFKAEMKQSDDEGLDTDGDVIEAEVESEEV